MQEIKLHPYQRRAQAAALDALKEGTSTLVVMPTGCGKTILFSSLLQARSQIGRGMVIAHREELISQAVQKIRRVTGMDCDVEMAGQWADQAWANWRAPVVVSTIQTQISGRKGLGRMSRFSPAEFATLVIDEAHHATSDTYRRTIDYYRQNIDLGIIGVTATPNRADEEALGQVFGSCAFNYSLEDAVNEGWLCPIYQSIMPIEGMDISAVHMKRGDLSDKELAEEMMRQKILMGLANGVWREARGRKTLVFAASVEHAKTLCGIFNTDYQSGCARFISGKTPKEERREILASYSRGDFQILTNCGVLTEGFDEPGIEVVVPKPTKSTPLYQQMLGRATRTLPGVLDSREWDDDQGELGFEGECEAQALRRKLISESAKPHCEVLDLYCQTGKHKLVTAADALGGNYSDEVLDRARQLIGDGAEDITQRLKRAQAQQIAHETEVRLRRQRIEVTAHYRKTTANAFEIFGIQPVREYGWDKGTKPSEPQIRVLSQMKIPTEGLSKRQASQLIGAAFERRNKGLCTLPQMKVLRRAGLPTDLTFQQAREAIDTLAANSWRWPDGKARPGSDGAA